MSIQSIVQRKLLLSHSSTPSHRTASVGVVSTGHPVPPTGQDQAEAPGTPNSQSGKPTTIGPQNLCRLPRLLGSNQRRGQRQNVVGPPKMLEFEAFAQTIAT